MNPNTIYIPCPHCEKDLKFPTCFGKYDYEYHGTECMICTIETQCKQCTEDPKEETKNEKM